MRACERLRVLKNLAIDPDLVARGRPYGRPRLHGLLVVFYNDRLFSIRRLSGQ